MKKHVFFLLTGFFMLLGLGNLTFAQYNQAAGINRVSDIKKAKHRTEVIRRERVSSGAPQTEVEEDLSKGYMDVLRDDESFDFDSYDIEEENERVEQQEGYGVEPEIYEVDADRHGNAAGSEYDLAVDNAFLGQKIVIVQLYSFGFDAPEQALKSKGFEIKRYVGTPPSASELEKELDDACQLWVISNSSRMLNDDHLDVIKDFFDAGHGLYIWGDNAPFYADANFLMEALFDVKMNGNLPGGYTVGVRDEGKKAGLMPNHLISTGLEFVYEGITIATLDSHESFQPLIYGSVGNLVTAAYEHDGKRCIIDGGFTRLYNNWEDAGSGRYVKNAAAWLVNYEKFGESVTGQN